MYNLFEVNDSYEVCFHKLIQQAISEVVILMVSLV